jgi:UDP-N-acetylglucosamine acyltransferase
MLIRRNSKARMSEIHPTAFVDPAAELGSDVRVGPFCYIGPGVEIGAGCVLHAHATITGPARIGAHNEFFPSCVLGSAPQDLKYRGGPTRLEIGDHNVFREQVTIHRGTEVDRQSGGVTRVGDHNLLMVGVHLAHDARIDNNVIVANFVQIAGHAHLEDCVNVGGLSAMHHFVTIGRYSFVGGMTRVTSDVPPYMKVSGYDAAVRGFNAEGMRRWGLDEDSIDAMKTVYRLMYSRRAESGGVAGALQQIESDGLVHDEHVAYLIAFVKRRLAEGVFGRAREKSRSDTDADRKDFYSQPTEG